MENSTGVVGSLTITKHSLVWLMMGSFLGSLLINIYLYRFGMVQKRLHAYEEY